MLCSIDYVVQYWLCCALLIMFDIISSRRSSIGASKNFYKIYFWCCVSDNVAKITLINIKRKSCIQLKVSDNVAETTPINLKKKRLYAVKGLCKFVDFWPILVDLVNSAEMPWHYIVLSKMQFQWWRCSTVFNLDEKQLGSCARLTWIKPVPISTDYISVAKMQGQESCQCITFLCVRCRTAGDDVARQLVSTRRQM